MTATGPPGVPASRRAAPRHAGSPPEARRGSGVAWRGVARRGMARRGTSPLLLRSGTRGHAIPAVHQEHGGSSSGVVVAPLSTPGEALSW